MTEALEHDSCLAVHTVKPSLVAFDKKAATFLPLESAGVVTVVTKEVEEVEVVHLVDLTDHLWAEVVAQQVVGR